jgi:hypothetical protein
VRIRERCEDLFGRTGTRWRVIRTSNAYHFRDPLPSKTPGNLVNSSKSDFPSGTPIQNFSSSLATLKPTSPPLNPDLAAALNRLSKALGAIS